MTGGNLSNLNTSQLSYNRWISFFAFVYIVVAFGLNGMPGISRFSLFSAICIAVMLFAKLKYLHLPRWCLVYFLLYVYLIVPSFMLEQPPWAGMGALFTVALGSMSLGLALENRFTSYRVLVYAMTCAGFINILAILAGIDTTELIYGENLPGRSAALLGNSNFLAVSMAFPALMICVKRELFSKSLTFFSVFMATYGMVVSGSRKGVILLAAILLMVCVATVSSSTPAKRILVLLGTCAVFIAAGPILVDLSVQHVSAVPAIDRIQQLLVAKEESFSERLWLTNVGLSIWEQSPLWGEGVYQFARISGFGAYAHNNYVELLVSGGIIGASMFYLMHVLILWKSRCLSALLRLRVVIVVSTLLFIDTALVSFSDKAVMAVICILLATSKEELLVFQTRLLR